MYTFSRLSNLWLINLDVSKSSGISIDDSKANYYACKAHTNYYQHYNTQCVEHKWVYVHRALLEMTCVI